MSNVAGKTPDILESELLIELRKRVRKEGLDIDYATPSAMFKSLIEELHDKYNQRVVVLIDEYDKPILDQLENPEIAEANREVLRGFYGILKSMDSHLHFMLITGVSKFTKTSVFSGLNNLFDITMVKRYANICGIPIEDLGRCFEAHIEDLALSDGFAHIGDLHAEILAWYDGYSWDGKTRVINPYSLLSFFARKKFESFWYSSGTPTFLIGLIKNKPESFLALRNLELRERVLDSFDVRKMEIEPLLFQTGYLTVKEMRYFGVTESYLLKIPNLEVREAFYLNIIADFTERGEVFAETAYRKIKQSLDAGDLQGMLDILKSLFASIPHQLHICAEAYYHSIFYAIMSLLGFDADAEVSVSGGRIDATLELDDKVYVMEFKYVCCPRGATPEAKQGFFEKALDEGMAQMEAKGYAGKYAGCGKKVYQVAFAFLGRDDIRYRLVV